MTAKKPDPRSLRTPERLGRIFAALELGYTFETAAHLAGIHRSLIGKWMQRHEDFAIECRQAIAKGKVFVAGKLMELIKAGNTAGIIFWLKCRTEEFQENQYSGHAEASEEGEPDQVYL